VNLAARIAALAGPGEVWASAELERNAQAASDLAFVPLGVRSLKGVGDVQLISARWA
jgi:class 3 adenylate cyclase